MLSTPIMRSSETLLTPRPANKIVSKTRRSVPAIESRSSDHQSTQNPLPAPKQLISWTVVLGISFTLVFSAFLALQNLLSSLFVETSIGVKSLICCYSVATVSSTYSQFLVDRLTPSWVIVTSFVMTALYIAVYFYPRLYTLISAAVLLGLSLGPLRCAWSTILLQIACKLSSTDVSRELTIRRYFQRFGIFLNSGQVWGNLLTSLLFHYGDDIYIYPTRSKYPRSLITDLSSPVLVSPSLSRTIMNLNLCDFDQCKKWGVLRNNTPFAFIVPSNVSLMLVSVYLGLAFVGVSLATTLLDKFDVREDVSRRVTMIKTVRSYIHSFADPQLRLVCPLIFFGGLQQGFIISDFTRSYISCSLGLEAVGYALMTMGITYTIGSLTVYQTAKYINRLIFMVIGLSFHGGLITALWLWRPVKEDIVIFYIITAGWGVCTAIWETMTLTFIINTFANDIHSPLLAHFSMHCIGLTLAFVSSLYLCTQVKLYILASILLLSIVPYSVAEYRLNQKNKIHERTAVL